MRRLLMGMAALGATFAFGGSAALADVLVVRSMGGAAQAYPRGRSLPDSATIDLGSGDSLTVLGAGGTRTFRGPGRFRLNSAAQANPMAAAMGNRSRARVGAVRGGNAVPETAVDPWQVDATRSGTACVADPANVTLWRPNSAAAARLQLSGEGDAAASIDWPAGFSTLDWPDSIPVRSGSEYRIAGLGNGTTLRFVTVPRVDGTQEAAALLIRHGCEAQLDRLIEAS